MWNFVPVEFGVSTIICLVSIIQVAALSVLFYFAFPHKQRWMTDSICFSWNEIFFEFPRCWMSNSSCIFSEKESKEEWVSEWDTHSSTSTNSLYVMPLFQATLFIICHGIGSHLLLLRRYNVAICHCSSIHIDGKKTSRKMPITNFFLLWLIKTAPV